MRKSGKRLFEVSKSEEKNAWRVLGGSGRVVLEDGGRYCGGIEGSIDDRIERVLVGMGREEDDDGDESSAEA
jgi:hypothetical protein